MGGGGSASESACFDGLSMRIFYTLSQRMVHVGNVALCVSLNLSIRSPQTSC